MRGLKKLGWFVLSFILAFIVFGYQGDIPADEIKAKYSYSDSHFLEHEGLEIHYRVTGEGPDVVLLHGTASSLHTWEDWTEDLKKDHRVISLDLPGFGLTGPEPSNNYSPSRYVEILHAVMMHLEVDSCVMAGNSFGGFVAWNYAVKYPASVNKLCLINSSGYPRGDQPTPLSFKLATNPITQPLVRHVTPRMMVSRTVDVVFFDDTKITDQLVDRYYEMLLRDGNRDGLIGRLNQVKNENSEDIKKIACPTLIMWGDDDQLVRPEDAYKFESDIAGSRLIMYENMGHVPMEEIPERSVADFSVFLAE